MTAEEFHHILPSLPKEPGVYRYYDKNGILLYVGKAKNIRNRVSSYFSGKPANQKTTELVSRIHTIEYTIAPSETDALFLENTLIKKHQPKFNIELKDDKTYPFIVIKNEPYPRIFLTRRKIHDGSTYIGPYSSVGKVRELIEFVQQHLPIRTCSLPLTPKNIAQKKFKKCLEYQLGNCHAPCEALQSESEYMENVSQIKNMLNGNLQSVIRFLKAEMKIKANELNFEKAAILQKKILYLENYQSKSTVVNAGAINADVFYLIRSNDMAFMNYLMVRGGTVIQSNNSEVATKLDETDAEILATLISHFRSMLNSDATEVIIPFPIDWVADGIKVTVPRKGGRFQLLEMSRLNAFHLMQEHQRKQALHLKARQEDLPNAILHEIQKLLHLKNIPVHIECFDNSNFHGAYPVAAMVCFKNGLPSKKDYRTFNIKTVTGINDFASMKEVVYRRYARLINEHADMPQLVIIDGGKGQLNAAYESISELGLTGSMTLIGLAKNVEEIFFIGDLHSLKLPVNDPVLLLIRKIRDEVHRFGISFHRNKRSKGTFKNELSSIKGIGNETLGLLLKTFKSNKGIKEATLDQLEKLIGKQKAKLIQNYFKIKGEG
jgi:excinuclease ABC subunit C